MLKNIKIKQLEENTSKYKVMDHVLVTDIFTFSSYT